MLPGLNQTRKEEPVPVQKVISFFRARSEKKKDDARRRAEALRVFLERLEKAFPGRSSGPKKISQKSADIAREKLSRRRESNAKLTEQLKSFGVDAGIFAYMTAKAEVNQSAYARRWVGLLAKRNEVLLSQIEPIKVEHPDGLVVESSLIVSFDVDVYPTVLFAVKKLFASDIASDIFVRDAARVVAEKVFVSPPAKRA